MKFITQKTVLSFCISLLIFSLAALAIAGGLSVKRGGLFVSDKSKYGAGEHFSVLLVMTDYSPEQFDDYDAQSVENTLKTVSYDTGTRRVRSESMILLHFDPARNELILTPVSGYTLVSVNGEEMTLDNVASQYGTEILIEKIRAMTGLEIDKYMIFTPDSASECLDMLGEITYKNKYDRIWQDQTLGIDINIKSGNQTFDGKKTVDMIRYYSYPAVYTDKDEILLDFSKKIIKNLSDDFTYDELCGIMSSILDIVYVNSEFTENQVKKLYNSKEFEIKLLHLCGSFDDQNRFILDEPATLETFKPYLRIYS